MTLAGALDAAIKAVCPIYGVSIGVDDDKTTWRIDFTEDATTDQQAAAQKVLDAFDPATVPADVPAPDVLAILKKKGVITDEDIAVDVAAQTDPQMKVS